VIVCAILVQVWCSDKISELTRANESDPGGENVMVTESRLAANRINGRKSRGPKTAQGKAQARRNALRHGLAAVALRNPMVSAQIERMARAICGTGATAAQFEHALVIAEAELQLHNVRAARVATIARRRASGLGSAGGREEAGGLDRGGDHPGAAQRISIDRPRPAPDDRQAQAMQEQVDAFRAALPDLLKLERYEQRAWSRRQRAIRQFVAKSLRGAGDLDAQHRARGYLVQSKKAMIT
jgi:hypothetical protein